MKLARSTILVIAQAAFLASNPARAQCPPHWAQGIGNPGLDNNSYAVISHNDGTGSALYAGGFFATAGGNSIRGIARWNGATWSGVGGPGIDTGGVEAMTVFDFGNGPELYIGGFFLAVNGVPARSIAKWNGTTWSALGTGIVGSVYGLTGVHETGGPALYAVGDFSSAGGLLTENVAKWNGTAWSTLGSGTNDQVLGCTTYNDGSGDALFIGGHFDMVSGVPAKRVAKWNGTTWSALGNLGPVSTDHVHVLLGFNDNGNNVLVAGGSFASADGNAVHNICRWNGTTWQPFGAGFNGNIHALAVFDDRTGGGPRLYAGGSPTFSGLTPLNNVAKWNGSAWVALGTGVNDVLWFAAVHDFGLGFGPSLYFVGFPSMSGGFTSNHVVQWDPDGRPAITQNPSPSSVTAGQSAMFSAAAVGNPLPSYQWRRNSIDLVNGGNISGANSPTLTINPATAADAGTYDVTTSNACGSATSTTAELSVSPACPGDTYADAFVDGLDVPRFVECILTGSNCAATDLDGDTLTADVDTDDDVAAFVTRLLQDNSGCP